MARGFVGGDAIRIDGLRELSRALKNVEDGLQKEINGIFRQAADKVARIARGRIKSRTGKLAGSLQPFGTQRAAGVRMGRKNVPYAGPYEFGGYPDARPFIAEGRAIYPTFKAMAGTIQEQVEDELADLIRSAGLAPERALTHGRMPTVDSAAQNPAAPEQSSFHRRRRGRR